MTGLPGHPWKTGRMVHGGIVQSGVPMHNGTPWDDTRGYITRAVVLKTYYSDDKDWEKRAWAKGNVRGVCCDVRTYGRKSTPLWKVPVLQRAHGMHDEDIYIPRDSNQDLAPNGKLATLPSGKTGPKPTPAENLDGDHVLVGFLEGNPDAPVIFPFCLPHPSSKRTLQEADGRVKRIRHAGVSIEWTEDGDITIDASEAAKEKLGTAGVEQSNSGTGGKVTIQTKDGAGASSSVVLDALGGVKILDGGGDYIAWTKASKQIEVNAGTTIKLVAGSTYTRSAPSQTISGTSRTTTLTTDILTAATSLTVNSLSITLGATAPLPLVKWTPWAGVWASMTSELGTQVTKYAPGPQRPSTVDVGDYYNLLLKFQAVAAGYALPAVPTIITKAG